MGDKKIYIVAKIFDQRGCLAYCCKASEVFLQNAENLCNLNQALAPQGFTA